MLAATDGMTLGGASITNNAPWPGQWTALNPVTNGQCTLTVSAASAVVVKIHATTLFAPPVIMQDLPAQVTLVTGKAYAYSVGVTAFRPSATNGIAGRRRSRGRPMPLIR